MVDLMCGDCLTLMPSIADKSVDMILCDLPYGTTHCEWDKRIPFEPLWEQYNRIIKDNGAIVLFGSQPFTTDLINSQRRLFRYEIIWVKTQATGFYNAKKMPLRAHENILVFYKSLPKYNPQKYIYDRAQIGHQRRNSDYKKTSGKAFGRVSSAKAESWVYTDDGSRYPKDVVHFSNWNGALFGNVKNAVKHPTTKPVPLLEYLIHTYTDEGDLVLDNAMGSGSSGIAAVDLNRDFIGIEQDADFFKIAAERIGGEYKHYCGAKMDGGAENAKHTGNNDNLP